MLRTLLSLVLLSSSLLAQAPTVTKVEPPNWFAGVPGPQLLVYGTGLAGAHASLVSAPSGVSIAAQHEGKDGFYYFVRLSGTESAGTGMVRLRLTSAGGNQDITLPLQARMQQKPQPLTGNDVIYLIMPDRFADGDTGNDHPANAVAADRSVPRAYHGGDLKGVQQHLDYLKDLGATILWLTPVVDNPNDAGDAYHGYSAVDEYNTDEHLGSLADMRALTTAARAQGLRVYYDFVPNHVGPQHVWVQHAPQDCWLNGTLQNHAPFSDDFRVLMDPHATEAMRRNTVKGWFFGVLPDMNDDCPDVEKYWVDNATWWIETVGIDGFRIDTFPYSSRDFWSKWHTDIRKVYPKLDDVGEAINSQTRDAEITSFFQGGRKQYDSIDTQLTSVFDAPLQNVIRDVLLNGGKASALADVLSRDELYPHPEKLVTYFGNHDMDRFANSGADVNTIKIAYGLLATLRGIPQIYYGDEIGMNGGNDPDNRRDFPGGFPGDTHNAFTAAGRSADGNTIHDYVRAALRLRHAHPALQSGDLKDAFVSDSVFAFARSSGAETLLVVLNSSGEPQPVSLSNAGDSALPNAKSLSEIFALQPETVNPVAFANGSAQVNAAPRSLTVYSVSF